MTEQTATASSDTRGWPKGPTAFERKHGNAKMRVLTGAIGIPIVLAAVWFGGWAFFLFICAAIVGAMLEFYWICEAKGARPHKGVGVVFGLLLGVTFSRPFADALFVGAGAASDAPKLVGALHVRFLVLLGIVVLSVIVSLIAEMRRREHAPIVNVSTTLAGLVYVGLFLASLLGIREFFITNPLGPSAAPSDAWTARWQEVATRSGAYMVMATLVTIWVCDSAAYYVGRAMGKHKMAPRVSPKKTWEGGIGGAVFAVATMIGFKYWLLDFLSLGDAIALGLIIGILGQVGDLAESLFKRDAGVKDSSQLIPGHGGVFDRLDSLMFVAPLVYLYLNIIAFSRTP
jgi:phosphatidate cytidylyltransferase